MLHRESEEKKKISTWYDVRSRFGHYPYNRSVDSLLVFLLGF